MDLYCFFYFGSEVVLAKAINFSLSLLFSSLSCSFSIMWRSSPTLRVLLPDYPLLPYAISFSVLASYVPNFFICACRSFYFFYILSSLPVGGLLYCFF